MEPKMLRDVIDAEPSLLARDICRTVAGSIPTQTQVQELSRQLLGRHSVCRLEPVVSSEEIVEGYYRCLITDALVNSHKISPAAIPRCVNSSHRAVRRVCVASGRHSHSTVGDNEWRKGWALIQEWNPEVNVRVAGRPSPKRADLYVVTGRRVVSLEFKYVGVGGLRDMQGCAAQVRRHAECHAQAILILYSGTGRPMPNQVVQQLVSLTGARNVRVANLAGPEMPVGRGAA
jgi:hypothetical protein